MAKNEKLPRGIRKRGTAYQVSVTVNGNRKTGTAASLEAAKDLQTTLKSEAEKATLPARRVVTLQDMIDFTWRTYWRGSRSAKNHRAIITSVERHFDTNTPVQDIVLNDLRDWVEALVRQGNTDGTINRKLACMSRILRSAFEEGHIQAIPRMPRRASVPGRIRFLTEDEENTIVHRLRSLGKDNYADAVICLIDTGMRVDAELLSQSGRDLNLETRAATIWGRTSDGSSNKGKTNRTIPLTSRAFDIMAARKQRFGTGRLWPDISYEQLRKTWVSIREEMGLADDTQFVIHACRHTFGSRLAQRGVPELAIRDLMGHTDLKTTQIYTHLGDAQLRSAIECLEPSTSVVQIGNGYTGR